jgi:hypothetical protein
MIDQPRLATASRWVVLYRGRGGERVYCAVPRGGGIVERCDGTRRFHSLRTLMAFLNQENEKHEREDQPVPDYAARCGLPF